MHILERKIRTANQAGRKAVIPFITAGFPQPHDFWEHLENIDKAGADIIEIGVPFSDPVADGPVVEEASRRALEYGINLQDLLADLTVRAGKYKAALVLMGYYNPFLQYGLEKLARQARAGGVSGLIIPDLPHEESGPVKAALRNYGLALIPLVGPNTSRERMQLYAQDAAGYVYVVSVMGTTGARDKIAPAIANTLNIAKEVFSVPVALGFGLKTPAQLEALPAASLPDAAVMGSALLTHLDGGGSADDFLKIWFE